MLGEKHDLAHELPEFKDLIHDLKVSNRHFAKLFDEYDALDHQVRRCEAEIEVEGRAKYPSFKIMGWTLSP